jgi:ABC-2 type transport system ATP-binding protein
MSVKVEHLTKIYGEQRAVEDISFGLNPGHVLGFLGPNGAGKTTTMKIISCFIPPTEGEVNVCGYDIRHDSRAVRKNIGYLPEHNPLYPEMYVREYLEFVAGLHNRANVHRQRIDEMIGLTGLGAEQNKKIGQLSKGYKQRLGLAQAMLHDPKVLILDEPTAGLDPNQLTEIRNLIRRVGREKTVIFSTHIMQEVQAVSDRVLIINDGKLVADDTTTELQQRLAAELFITVGFKEDINTSRLNGIEGIRNITYQGDNTWQLTTEGNRDIREEIYRFAKDNDLTLLTLHKEERSLEDVFHHLTVKDSSK